MYSMLLARGHLYQNKTKDFCRVKWAGQSKGGKSRCSEPARDFGQAPDPLENKHLEPLWFLLWSRTIYWREESSGITFKIFGSQSWFIFTSVYQADYSSDPRCRTPFRGFSTVLTAGAEAEIYFTFWSTSQKGVGIRETEAQTLLSRLWIHESSPEFNHKYTHDLVVCHRLLTLAYCWLTSKIIRLFGADGHCMSNTK